MRIATTTALSALLAAVAAGSSAEPFELPGEYRPSPQVVDGLYVCRNDRSISHSLDFSANGTYSMPELSAGGGNFRLGPDGSFEWLSGPFAASEGDAVTIRGMNARRAADREPVIILLYDMPGVESRDYCFRQG